MQVSKEEILHIANLANLTIEEKEQIEEWTNKRCGNIVFDSLKDNWEHHTSEFDSKIFNRNQLLFLIEDEENIQLFVTRANIVTMNLDHLNQKYEGQPEYYYESFKKLMELNRFVKTITQLRQEAVTYQRYLSYQTS